MKGSRRGVNFCPLSMTDWFLGMDEGLVTELMHL